MIVISPDVPEEEIQSVIDRTGEFITGPGGELTSVNRESPWGRRRLAYPIRHNSRDVRDGFYTLYQFTIEPHKIEEIEREIRLTDSIIRHLVTQYTPRAEAPASEEAGEEGDEETPSTDAEPTETVETTAEAAPEATDADDIVIDEAPAAVEA
jgi:small subunit ribosomal protein S6